MRQFCGCRRLRYFGKSESIAFTYFSVIFGAAYGGFIALSPAVAAELFGLKGLGGVLGTWYTGAAFGALCGPFVAGSLIDAVDYWAAIVLAAAGALVGWALPAALG